MPPDTNTMQLELFRHVGRCKLAIVLKYESKCMKNCAFMLEKGAATPSWHVLLQKALLSIIHYGLQDKLPSNFYC